MVHPYVRSFQLRRTQSMIETDQQIRRKIDLDISNLYAQT